MFMLLNEEIKIIRFLPLLAIAFVIFFGKNSRRRASLFVTTL